MSLTVYPPGSSHRVALLLSASQSVHDAVCRTLDEAASAGLVARLPGAAPPDPRDYVLVAPGTRSFPLGVQLQSMLLLGDAMELLSKGASMLTVFRQVAVAEVLLPDGAESYLLRANLDAGSPLYTNAVILDNIFRRGEEFCFLLLRPDRRLFWLNANYPLAQQGYEPACRIVLLPLQRIMRARVVVPATPSQSGLSLSCSPPAAASAGSAPGPVRRFPDNSGNRCCPAGARSTPPAHNSGCWRGSSPCELPYL